MSELSSVSIDRVKVLVLGDSGVGKTSLVQLIASGQPIPRGPGWTAGCNIEVRYHEYAAGTSREQPYFVELWDVGGCQALQAVRPLFYGGAHGYILVHDMTNRKSLQNLKQTWLSELNAAANSVQSSSSTTSSPWSTSPASAALPTACLLPPHAPCLLIGTKLDALTGQNGNSGEYVLPISNRKSSSSSSSSSWPGLGVSITAESICKLIGGAEHITVDCHNARSLAPGSSNAVAITRFFDKVIDSKLSQGSNTLTGGIMTSSLSSSNLAASASSMASSSSLASTSTSSILSGSAFSSTVGSRLSGSGISSYQNPGTTSSSSIGLGQSARDRHRVSGLLLK